MYLQSNDEDFEALPWYSAVEKFCHGQGHMESEDADVKTIPAIVEKTVLPKVQGLCSIYKKHFVAVLAYCTCNINRGTTLEHIKPSKIN